MNRNSSPDTQNPLKRVRESAVCATGFNPFSLSDAEFPFGGARWAIYLPTTGNHTSHTSSTTQNITAPVSSSGGPGS